MSIQWGRREQVYEPGGTEDIANFTLIPVGGINKNCPLCIATFLTLQIARAKEQL